jgi:hypothetical protein
MVPIASMSVESCTRGCTLRDLRSTAGRLLLGACFATCTRRFRFVTHFGWGKEFCVMASWRKPATEVAAT